MSHELAHLKQKILNLESEFNIFKSMLPTSVPLVDIAKRFDIPRQSLHYHLETKYTNKVDFYKQNGRMYISVGILPNIKAYYEK